MDDWGAPRTDWEGPRETVKVRLPLDVVAVLRHTARSRGMSANALLVRLIEEGLDTERLRAVERELDLIGL
jgi:hypothetical protein